MAMSGPSSSATICAIVVSWLCPWLIVPVVTVTAPLVSIRTSERSKPGTTAILRCANAAEPYPVRSLKQE
ncbi:hypothetical protein GCM10010211_27830 [Streptomyces albospinus]|uniref:Secreted peptide n=1 Tax=Streptomyces albospinus TaxID=285515 RepID=A0ABQ2V1E2_9ACTN|nr:hypothetical protein GCM10010211_27830 [Streptomyces albospinus]